MAKNPTRVYAWKRAKTRGIFDGERGAKMNIEEIYESHYLPEKARKRRASTVAGYDSSVRLHVLPRWGAYGIEEIDPDELQAWVDSFDRPGAAEKAFKCLRQVIRWAIKKKRLHIPDPTVYIELPEKPHYTPQTLDAEELVEFQRGFWGHELEAFVLIDSSLGPRRGEACAVDLQKDVNWKTGEVRLGPSRQCILGEVMTLPAKTEKSNRVGYLPKYVLRRLKQICKGRKGLVIGDLTPDQVARRIKSHCKRHGLPYVSPTNMRHTWATLAVEAGVGIETVAMMLGHTDITTAYDHYIVPRKSICVQAQDAVEKYIFAHAPKPRPLREAGGAAIAA